MTLQKDALTRLLRAGTVAAIVLMLVPGASRADDTSPGAPPAADAASPAEVTFRLNPPDGVTFLQTSRLTRHLVITGLADRTETRVEKARMTIRRTATGISLSETPVAASVTVNGKPVKDRVASALLNSPIGVDLNSSGQVIAFHGVDQMAQKIRAVVPRAAAQAAESKTTAEGISRALTASLNRNIGEIAGRSARAGDTWATDDQVILPTGDLAPAHTTIRIAGYVDRAGKHLARVQGSFTADPSSLPDIVGDSIGNELASIGASQVQLPISDVEDSGEAEDLVDPATMLTYSSRSTQTLRFNMDVPEQGKVPTTLQETEEASYDYNYHAPATPPKPAHLPAKLQPKPKPRARKR